MTKIKIDMTHGTYDAVGHAGFGKAGEDIVCAAVSAISQVMVLHAMRHGGAVTAPEGEVHIAGTDEDWPVVLEACADALQMYGMRYPCNVQVKVRR